jgi:holliday junction DNA helicase RuvB
MSCPYGVKSRSKVKLEEVQSLLKQRIERSKTEQRLLDHILLCGPYELTQEVFSHVSSQTQVRARVLAAANFPKVGDWAAILTHLRERDMVYIHELHLLKKVIIPVLHSAMQNYIFDVVIGEGKQAKNVRINLPRFTVIATTTRPTLLPYQLHTLFHTEYQVNT